MKGSKLKKIYIAVCFLLCAGISSCFAAEIHLPESLIVLEEDAFADCEAVREITIPDGTEVADGALDGLHETLWVHCGQGDFALGLLNSGIDTDAHSVCRALAVGQTYEGTDMRLYGTWNDATAIRNCLEHQTGNRFQVSCRKNLTADGIKAAIRECFRDATVYDISLFYYSGHGSSGGYLVGAEDENNAGGSLSPEVLRSVLDEIPGRKVILIDACHSGAIIDGTNAKGKTRGVEPQAEDFNKAFLNAFSGSGAKRGSKSGESFSRYYIMTAAAADEVSWETSGWDGSGRSMGVFTYYLCIGCGWDGIRSTAVSKAADANADGLVTFGEAFVYARDKAYEEVLRLDVLDEGNKQNVQSNAGDLQAFSPFR